MLRTLAPIFAVPGLVSLLPDCIELLGLHARRWAREFHAALTARAVGGVRWIAGDKIQQGYPALRFNRVN